MEFDFVIPISLEGLQEASSSRQYSVANISSSKEIPQRLRECNQSFHKDGPKFILDQNCFDALYSVLVKFKNIEEDISLRVWDLIIKVMESMTTNIHNLLEENVCHTEYNRWLLILKMNTYIACNLTEIFESKFNTPVTDIALLGKKGRKGSKKNDLGLDWEEERTRMLIQLYSLIHCPLNRLWDPPVIDEDYVNLIANCCYKILETPSLNLVRTKAARETILQIIATLVKKFNHGLACSLKFMQLLQHFEHLVGPLAQGIIIMQEGFDSKAVLQEMVREISKIDSQDFKDSSGLRNYSQFLIDIAEKCPQIFIPSLPLLVSFLHQEVYAMRNCVLYIMGAIVLKVLKGESLESKSKILRDECLGYLQEFIHDINSFVRSKVLQIWEELIEGQAIPLSQHQQILKRVVGRLRDKSSTVRKFALHLLAAFLKANPFASKLSVEDLKQQFEIEMVKLEEMKPGVTLTTEEEDEEEHEASIENTWIEIVPDVIKAIKKLIKEDTEMEISDEDTDDQKSLNSEKDMDERNAQIENNEANESPQDDKDLPVNFSLNEGVSIVGEKLLKKDASNAVRFLQKVLDNYKDDEVFQVDEDDDCTSFEILQKMALDSHKRMFLILHRIFTSYMKMKKKIEEEKEAGKDKDKAKKQFEFRKQKMLCCYLRDSINFAREIQKGLPDACQLLSSRQITDITEAVDFFVTAYEFGVKNAVTGIRKMLVLIWSKEASIKEIVVKAYKRLYIDVNAPNERAKAFAIVKNLTSLITEATLGELTSMEEIVSEFCKTGHINRHCITLLWERFTKNLPETTDEESLSSLILLTMAAKSDVTIISTNLSVLLKTGLGETSNGDCALVKATCVALCKMAVTKLKTDDPNPPLRFEKDHDMFKKMNSILQDNIFSQSPVYSPMAIEVINAIYSLAENPDIICGQIIQDIFLKLKEKCLEIPEKDLDSQDVFKGIHVTNVVLTRLLTIIGHVALRQLIHLDTFIFMELKRRNYLREQQEQTNKKKSKKKAHRKSSNITSASEVSVNKSQEGDIDEEMGLTGAVADDMEADYIRSICEKEIVNSDSILAALKPLVISICANPSKYSDPNVRTSAALALAKFMLVSSECCEENLQLLFTILEKSSEEVIRANTIIAVGDLIVRFPNLVEPWTPRIYGRLRDECTMVRRNTLTVLTHLILNDQVKVKGQISDIALCLTDGDIRISGLAKLFFNELAKKGNTLYNVLPDIISRLCDAEIGTEEENFRKIISHIFGLIQKDRQLESFIEKLCHRLQATQLPRQWRDLSYCLALLPYSDKGVQKLIENFSAYGDKLHEEDVYNLFMTILSTAKKSVKAESKTVVEEFESRLEECRKKNVEDENVIVKARSGKVKATKKGQQKVPKKKSKVFEGSDFESDEENNDMNEFKFSDVEKVDRPRRSVTRKYNQEVHESSENEIHDSDDDKSEEEAESEMKDYSEEESEEKDTANKKQKLQQRKNTRMSTR